MKAVLQSRWFVPGQPAFRMTPRFVRVATLLCPLLSAAIAFGILHHETNRHALLARELGDATREIARLEALRPAHAQMPHLDLDHDSDRGDDHDASH